LQTSGSDATLIVVRAVRRPWLIFGALLTCGIIGFTISADWSAQSWLDVAAYVVSVIAIIGVLIYAFGAAPAGPVFWGAFRWVFAGVAAAQVLVHAMETAEQHGYSVAGTIAFVVVVGTVMGLIFAFQWVVIARLADKR
jgi:hypothetical protein